MALSFLSQNSGLLDLQTLFDPQYSLLQQTHQHQHQQHQSAIHHQQQHHQHQQQQHRKFEYTILSDFDQMEYNNNNNNDQQLNRNQSQYQNQNNNHNNNNNNNHIHAHQANNNSAANNNQIPTRHYMSGYHHQHIGTDYEQVINFVDSPPNSEESWTADTQSKDSPGPQIIDVQTIYTNSGSRKRRMDWDSLDIGQNDNATAATQNDEMPIKVSSHQEKDKHKREKHSGRSSWSDDIGFDLNAEFNSNSYLNNESFLTFSPGLTALKQEPQGEPLAPSQQQLQQQQQQHQHQHQQQHLQLKSMKGQLNLIQSKIDKSSISESIASGNNNGAVQDVNTTAPAATTQKISKNERGNNFCGCGSPQRSPSAQDYELNNGNEKTVNSGVDAFNSRNVSSSVSLQHLNVVDKLGQQQQSPSGNANATATHAEDHKFQYILAAATSIATKNNEETLTYLNQGQSYEIKLKKIGDLSYYRDKILKSVIKICFHERRLQFMEREQMQQWQASRPGERIIEVDVPLSYGLYNVSQSMNPNALNTVEIFWDPLKEVGVYIKVNCISTEFTPKKHGGEKGVPFRLQIETYIENTTNAAGTTATTTAAVVGGVAGVAAGITTTTSNTNTITNNNNANANNNNNNNTATSSTPTIVSATTAAVGAAASSTAATVTPGNRTPNAASAAPVAVAAAAAAVTAVAGNMIGNGVNLSAATTATATALNWKQAVHAAACQIKVFKLKGADRKHKQDREKIQKRPQSEQDKFQPSYECTIMNDISLDLITPAQPAGCYSPEYMKIWPNSPVHIPKYDGILPYNSASPATSSSPIAINSVTSTNSPSTLKLMDTGNMVSPQHIAADIDDYSITMMPESTPAQVTQWLNNNRLTAYLTTFAQFSGADIMRMSKEDLIQICGLADGIRMFNILRAKTITPRLTLYVSLDGCSYNAIYLLSNTAKELTQKLFKLPGFYEAVAKSVNGVHENGGGGGNSLYNNWNGGSMHSKYSGSGSNIFNDVNKCFIYISGPSGIHVTITDEVLNNEIKDGSLYALEVQNGKVVLKLISKNEN